MMIEPPIDELVKKTKGNAYVLCNIVAKKAKEIEATRKAELDNSELKSISVAANEVYQGQVVPSDF